MLISHNGVEFDFKLRGQLKKERETGNKVEGAKRFRVKDCHGPVGSRAVRCGSADPPEEGWPRLLSTALSTHRCPPSEGEPLFYPQKLSRLNIPRNRSYAHAMTFYDTL